MRNLVNISLILLVTIILGVTMRYTMFGKFMNYEGFEDAPKEEEKKEEDEKKEPVQLDTEGNLKNFLNENGNNKKLMSSLTEDTQAMMNNQKELMEMMRTVQPALRQGMEFMKAFKGMMGPSN